MNVQFSLGQTVVFKINAIPGRVVSIWTALDDAPVYQVVWWSNGERFQQWVKGDEIQAA